MIQSTFTSFDWTSFDWLVGLGMYSSSGTVYYYHWWFISFERFNSPYKMISIGNSIYMTGDYNVWKLDQDLNILINYYGSSDNSPGYRGISYNPSNGLIYVVASFLFEIQVFNLYLNILIFTYECFY